MCEKNIGVSVVCLAYNHEKYIRQTLEGFVNQKTDFPYEVLINEDCSTDSTAAIIREYEEKYPHIIKPVYQRENQYSRGGALIRRFLLPKAVGKYIAVCEGDDYWTDENKLQKQYDFLENHPECTACVHRALYRDLSAGVDTLVPNMDASRDYTLEEIVMEGGGIFATNSVMISREGYLAMPQCFHKPYFSDYQMFMYAAMEGKIHCLADVMSVYHSGVSGSWTDTVWKHRERRIRQYETCIGMLQEIDAHYEGRFHDILARKILETEYQIHKVNEDVSAMKQPQYRAFYMADRRMAIKGKIVKVFPFVLRIKRFLVKGT